MFWFFGPKACGILVPWLGIEPPAWKVKFYHWTFREVPGEIVLFPSWNFILLIHSIDFIINISWETSVQFSSVIQSWPTLCNPMNRSRPGIPVHHQLPKFTQTHLHESVMPSSHPILCQPLLLLPPIPLQHQGLFQWVNSSHEVAKVLEFQLQHQSFQRTPRTDLL